MRIKFPLLNHVYWHLLISTLTIVIFWIFYFPLSCVYLVAAFSIKISLRQDSKIAVATFCFIFSSLFWKARVVSLLITHSRSQAGLITMGPAWNFPSLLDPPWSYLEKPAPWSPVLFISEKPLGCSEALGVQCGRYVWSVTVNAAFRPFSHVKPRWNVEERLGYLCLLHVPWSSALQFLCQGNASWPGQ